MRLHLIAAGRWVRAAAAGWLLLCLPFPLRADPSRPGATPARSPSPCEYQSVTDRMSSIATDGEIALAEGGAARLAGIRFPDDGPFRQQAVAWLAAFVGEQVSVLGSDRRDRWGRRLVRVQREGPTGSVDLGRGLVESGLAIVDPQRVDRSCADDFLASEAGARQRSLGVWADAGYKPIGTHQADRLKDRIGTFVIVEGRVRNVGERAQWTYLNFGGRWAGDFTVIIPKRIWKRMTDRGGDAAAFRGRPVRVRGILEAWQGASVTVEIPEMIEFLPR